MAATALLSSSVGSGEDIVGDDDDDDKDMTQFVLFFCKIFSSGAEIEGERNLALGQTLDQILLL